MHSDPAATRRMVARLRSSGLRGPWLPLLAEVLHLAGDSADLVHHSERAWSSVTFSGSRHTIRLDFTGSGAMESAETFIAQLPEHEFAIPQQVVADATVTSVEQMALPEPRMLIECELLLLEDT